MSGPATGRHFADGLSRLIADSVARTKAATAGHEAAMANAGKTAYLESLEREWAPHMREAFGWILEQENAPEMLKVIAGEAINPGNQFAAVQQAFMTLSFLITCAFRMGEPITQKVMNDLWTHDPDVPLTPQEAALAVLKGWMDQESGAQEALMSGVNHERFDHMVKSAGNPPGPEELLSLYRRGIIDATRFNEGILQSHVRPEWFDTYMQRHFDPLSPSDAIMAAVQSQMDYPTAQAVAAKTGLAPEDFDVMYRVHGNPPGPHEAGEMFHRGILSEPDAKQAIRESRIKNKYVDAMLAITQRIPPERSVVMMVAHGAIPQQDGINRLLKLGFSAEDAAALTSEAMNRKHAVTRNLAQTQIIALYEESSISTDQALGMLKELGYDPQEAAWLMLLADTSRERHFQQSSISKVHSLYVGHKIERPEAGTDLDKLKVPPTQRDHLLSLWDLERTSNVQHLTGAQLSGAYNAGYITEGRYERELTRMGYTDFAITILKRLHDPGRPADSTAIN